MEVSATGQNRGRPKPPTAPKPTGQQAHLVKQRSVGDKKLSSKTPPLLPKHPPAGQPPADLPINCEKNAVRKPPPPLPAVPPVGSRQDHQKKFESLPEGEDPVGVHCPSSGVMSPGAAADDSLLSGVAGQAAADDPSGASGGISHSQSLPPSSPASPPVLKPKPKHGRPRPVPKKRISLTKKQDFEVNDVACDTHIAMVTGVADMGTHSAVLATGEGTDGKSRLMEQSQDRWPKREDVHKKLVHDLDEPGGSLMDFNTSQEAVSDSATSVTQGIDTGTSSGVSMEVEEAHMSGKISGTDVLEQGLSLKKLLKKESESEPPLPGKKQCQFSTADNSDDDGLALRSAPKNSSPVPMRPPRTKNKKFKKSESLQSVGSFDSADEGISSLKPKGGTKTQSSHECLSPQSESVNSGAGVRSIAASMSDVISKGLHSQLWNKKRPQAPPKPSPKPSQSVSQGVESDSKRCSLNRSDSYQAALCDDLDSMQGIGVAETDVSQQQMMSSVNVDDDLYDDVVVPSSRCAEGKQVCDMGIQVLPAPRPRKSADNSSSAEQQAANILQKCRSSPPRKRTRSRTVEALCDSSADTSPEESDAELKSPLLKSKSLDALQDEKGGTGKRREKPIFVPPPPPPYSELGLDIDTDGYDNAKTATKMVQTPSGSLEDLSLQVEKKSNDLKNLSQSGDLPVQNNKQKSGSIPPKIVPSRKAPAPPSQKRTKNTEVNKQKSLGQLVDPPGCVNRPLPIRPAPAPPTDKSKTNRSGSITQGSKIESEYDYQGYLAPSGDQLNAEESGEYAYVDVPLDMVQEERSVSGESTSTSNVQEKMQNKRRSSDNSSRTSFGSHLYELIRSRTGSKTSSDGDKENRSSVFYYDVDEVKKKDMNTDTTDASKIRLSPKSRSSNTTHLSEMSCTGLESDVPPPAPQAPPRMKRKGKKNQDITSPNEEDDDDYIYPENLNPCDSDVINNNTSKELPTNSPPDLPPELPPRQPSMRGSHMLDLSTPVPRYMGPMQVGTGLKDGKGLSRTVSSEPNLEEENEYTVPEELEMDNGNVSAETAEQEVAPPALPPRMPRTAKIPSVMGKSDSLSDGNENSDSEDDDDYIYPEKVMDDVEDPEKTPELQPRSNHEKGGGESLTTSDKENDDGEYVCAEYELSNEEGPYSEVNNESSYDIQGSSSTVSNSPSLTMEQSTEYLDGKGSVSDSECMYPGQSTPVKLRKNNLQKLHIPNNNSGRPSSWTGSIASDDESYISMQKSSHSDMYVNQQALNNSSFMSDLSYRDSTSTIHTDPTESDEEQALDEETLQAKEEKKQRKVFCIAEEIMASEKAFVDQLKLLNIDFRSAVARETARLDHAVVPSSVLNQVLKYLPQLQNFNEELLKDITNRVISWKEDPRVADIFVKKGPFLKLYTSYIREFEGMCSALEEARKKYPEFDKVVKEFEASARCRHLALKHYMLKPIQRIPQYRLLLQDYLKHLSEDSPDYKDTEIALVIVSEVAEHANQSMKYGDNFKKLWEIQSSLIGQFEVIKPGRYFIKEGILQKLSRKEMQPRMFFLLDDMLLYTTPVSGGYKLNNAIPLAGMKVSKPTKEDFQNEFSILSTQRSFTISASTAQERDEWLEALQTSVQDNVKRRHSFDVRNIKHQPTAVAIDIEVDFKLGTRAPVWVPDVRVSMCMLCTSEFTVTFRRHHCRACGKVVCGFCSDYRAPLRYLKYSAARVCADCYDSLSKEFENIEEEEVPVTPSTEKSEPKTSPFSRASIKTKFRGFKMGSFGRGKKRRPAVLQEVHANAEDADMSGYLKVWKGNKWKKMWFVLKGKALYTYKASEDAAAMESTVLLGYEVKPFNTWFEGVEPSLVFELAHRGTPSIVFRTESPMSKEKWMKAMQDATVP